MVIRAPKFIAEASSNHGQDMGRAVSLVEAAAHAGFDAVKFQLFRVDELFAPAVWKSIPDVERRRAWELPPEFIPELSAVARQSGLEFSCTPFSLRAVVELVPHVDFLKIASYELLWDDLLRACAETGLPVVLSTGMASMDEVDHAVEILAGSGCRELTLLHCVSTYPAPRGEANLAAIAALRTQHRTLVGWSDHTNDPSVVLRAVHRWDAQVVELHLDVDGVGEEYAPGHCWLPDTSSALIKSIRDGLEADGHGAKEPALSELSERDWRADPLDGFRPRIPKRTRSE